MTKINDRLVLLPLDPTATKRLQQFKTAESAATAYKVAAVVSAIFIITIPLTLLFLNKAKKSEAEKEKLFTDVLTTINKDLSRTGTIVLNNEEFNRNSFNRNAQNPVTEHWTFDQLNKDFGLAQRVKQILKTRLSDRKTFAVLLNCMQGMFAPVLLRGWKRADAEKENFSDHIVVMPQADASQRYHIHLQGNRACVSTTVRDQLVAIDSNLPNHVRDAEAEELRSAQVTLIFNAKTQTLQAMETPIDPKPSTQADVRNKFGDEMTTAMTDLGKRNIDDL